jgi:hypothetical protein
VNTEPGDVVIFTPWTFHAVESLDGSNLENETASFLWSPIRFSSAAKAQPFVTLIFFIRLAQTIGVNTWFQILSSWLAGDDFAQAFAQRVYGEQGDTFGDESRQAK